MESQLEFWRRVARTIGERESDNTRDIAAAMAVALMVDALEHGRPVPRPTPEFNAKLAWAEVIAQGPA